MSNDLNEVLQSENEQLDQLNDLVFEIEHQEHFVGPQAAVDAYLADVERLGNRLIVHAQEIRADRKANGIVND